MQTILNKIKEFAAVAHGNQLRKYTPEPYIVHPIRVMQICEEHTADLKTLSAALLHDVIEDTSVTKQQLGDFLKTLMNEQDADQTLRLVVELTDVYVKKDYPQWNRRKRKALEQERMEKISSAAQTIKYADIIDNAREIANHDASFGKVFLHECKALLKKMTKGDTQLYLKATEIVETNIRKLRGEIKKA